MSRIGQAVNIDLARTRSKSVTVENPTDSEDISLFFTNRAITLTEILVVLIGNTSPSVTWTIKSDTDRSAVGTEAIIGGVVTTSTTIGSDVISFDDSSVPTDSYVWLETTAQGGTVTQLHLTVFYTIDS